MGNHKFIAEFEINASSKMIFPYLNTPSGLAQWFADDVMVDEDKVFNFIWDHQDHKARLAAQKMNHYVKFEFLSNNNSDKTSDSAHIELRLETNELTNTTFLRVLDCSEEDEEELYEIWKNIVYNLKEIVGG